MARDVDLVTPTRAALKLEYRELYDQVAEILFRIDPVGINFDDNWDEYYTEANTILPRIANCESRSAIRAIVVEEFTRWFGSEIVSRIEKNKLDHVATEIWDALRLFRGGNRLGNNDEQSDAVK